MLRATMGNIAALYAYLPLIVPAPFPSFPCARGGVAAIATEGGAITNPRPLAPTLVSAHSIPITAEMPAMMFRARRLAKVA